MNPITWGYYIPIVDGVVVLDMDLLRTYPDLVLYRADSTVISGLTAAYLPSGGNPTTSLYGVPVKFTKQVIASADTYDWVTLTDAQAPTGTTVYYRMAYKKSDGTYETWSDWMEVPVPASDKWLLSDPRTTDAVVELVPEFEDIDLGWGRARGVFTPLRGNRDIVMVGPMRGYETQLTVIVKGADAWTNLRRMLAHSNPLMLRTPELGSIYIAPTDRIEWTRIAQAGGEQLRRVTVPVLQVAR